MIRCNWIDKDGLAVTEDAPWWIWLMEWVVFESFLHSVELNWLPWRFEGEWSTFGETWGDVGCWLSCKASRRFLWIIDHPSRKVIGRVSVNTAALLWRQWWMRLR